MRIKLILLAAIFFFGCSKKYCQEKYPCAEKDSASFIQTYNIDTIYIQMNADTTYIESKLDCPDQKIVYREGKVEYKVLIKDKVLTISRISEADSMRLIYGYKNTDEFRRLTQLKIVPEIHYKTPKWAYYSLAVSFLLIAWVTRKIWLRLIV